MLYSFKGNNSTYTMNEDFNSQEWTVNRIDYLHHNMIDQLRLDQEKFENDVESFYEPFKMARNYVLFGLLISIIAIIGTRELSIINSTETLWSVVVSITTGVTAYLVIDRTLHYYSKPFDAILSSYANGQSRINNSLTYFNTLTLNLNNMDLKALEKYSGFTINLALATKISLLLAVRNAQKRILPQKIKIFLNDQGQTLESDLKGSNNISKLLDTENLPEELVEFTNMRFSEFKTHQIVS